MTKTLLLFTVLCVQLAGCANVPTDVARVSSKSRMIRQDVSAGAFTLTTYARIADPDLALHIYIESDGRAWLSRHQVSPDPTPRRATALLLASIDDWPNVVYLARPCQFRNLSNEPCDSRYWTDERFSQEVIKAIGLAVDDYLHKTNIKKVELIGYSGGGAVAALLAATRSDVTSLRTVAGNLDHHALNRYHGVSQMQGSLNPIDIAAKLKQLPQRHFIGKHDNIVPATIATDFSARTGGNCSALTVLDDASHEDGWVESWPALLEIPLPCDSSKSH